MFLKIVLKLILKTLKLLIKSSDLPDLRSGSGSGWIRPFFAWIRIRPDSKLKKRSGSGSGRILAEIWPDPDPVILKNVCFPPSAFSV